MSDSPAVLTSRKLAEHLGLAQATISMALHDHPEISLATRRRVQRAAARLHYTPLTCKMHL